MKFLISIAAFCLLFTAGCLPQTAALKPVLAEEGSLYLFVQPFPQEADALRFRLLEMTAVRDDGAEFPVSLLQHDYLPREIKQQRLAATAVLPPGTYRALRLRPAGASMETGEGTVALLVSQEPASFPAAFTMAAGKATTLALSFRPQESMGEGYSFTPVFSALRPATPGIGLIGYVSNHGSDTVTVFDKQSLQVASVIATGRGPAGIAFDRLARRGYVALSGDDAIEVLDLATSSFIRRIYLHPGDAPQEVLVVRDGRLLISVNTGSSSISFIDPATGTETSRLSIGNGPGQATADPSGNRLYLLNTLADSMSVADSRSQRHVGTVATEASPSRPLLSPRGDLLYVASAGSPYLTVFDPATLMIRRRFYVGAGLDDLKSDAAGATYFGAKGRLGQIELYEPSSFVPLETIATGGTPSRLALDAEGSNLLVIDRSGKRLLAVNIVTRKIVGRLDLGDDPYSLAVMGER